jgi:hypothetical protein
MFLQFSFNFHFYLQIYNNILNVYIIKKYIAESLTYHNNFLLVKNVAGRENMYLKAISIYFFLFPSLNFYSRVLLLAAYGIYLQGKGCDELQKLREKQ